MLAGHANMTEANPRKRGRYGGSMARNEARLEAAHEAVRSLVAAKLRFLVPMTIIFMVGYIGLTVIAKGLMAVKVAGSLNLGFALIAVNYVLSWILALAYERIANRVFDPLASKADPDGRYPAHTSGEQLPRPECRPWRRNPPQEKHGPKAVRRVSARLPGTGFRPLRRRMRHASHAAS
jgi:uncharacterized membrane protein (DUF485 family)